MDAEHLVSTRAEAMVQAIKEIRGQFALDHIFLNIVDLEKSRNFIVADDRATQNLLTSIFSISWQGNFARTHTLVIRKEIAPLLKAVLEMKAA